MKRPCLYACIGGWLPVNEEYVEAMGATLPERMPDELRARNLAAFRDSVSPCPACRPEQYELWRGGHFAPNHTCEECVARRGKRRGRAAA